jgi:flagellar assembly protein FliH
MVSNGKLIKANDKYRPATNIVIGGADLSDLPNKQDLIDEHLHEARSEAEAERLSIIEQAKQEAEHLLNQAHEEAQQKRLAAYEEGFQTGKAEAMMLIKEDFRETLVNANNVLSSIEKEREECLAEEEARVYQAIVKISKQLLKRDLTLNPEISMEFITQALKKLDSKAEVKVLVDTDTAQSLHSSKNELMESVPGIERLTIVANADLAPGDLILESNTERLDLRLETQLEELAQELLK